jgi:hypothetical protein
LAVVGETYVRVRPDATGFAAALETQAVAGSRKAGLVAGKQAGHGFSEGFKSALKVGAGIVALTGITEGIKSVVSESARQAGELALVENATKKAHASNTLYGQSIHELVRSQSLQKGFTDEELYPSLSRLVTATGSLEKGYKDLSLAQDVARQRGIGVAQAALALAKAEDGSVTSLQRLGVILPEYIRKLPLAQKETAALAFVQEKFGGSAATYAQTSAGQFDRFNAALHVARAEIGEAIVPELANAAGATADWFSKSENLERVQKDVASATHLVAGGVRAISTGFHVLDAAVTPVVHTLGGVEKTVELAFGALAVRKVQTWGKALVASGTAAAAGETEAAVATSGYTAALVANTAALEANAVAQRLSLGGVSTLKAGTAAVEAEQVATVATSGRLATGFARLGVSGTDLASVLKGGMAPAVVIAGYELSTFIEKIPHEQQLMESLGGTAEHLAEKLGLIGKSSAVLKEADFGASIQKQLQTAYKQAAAVPNVGNIRDQIIQKLVGPGYTFHDAQVFATARAQALARPPGATPHGNLGDVARAAVTPTTPDLDYRIRLQEALATKQTSDELALYQTQLKYVDARIASFKRQNDLTAGEKKRLLEREGEAAGLQSSIEQIQKQAVDDAKAAADKARQAYTDSISVRDQAIQLQAQRAQLTANSYADDLKAARVQLDFDRTQAVNAKLDASTRAQYASAAVTAEQQILTINKSIHDKETQAFTDAQSLREQKLQLALKRAELTQGSIADDQRAERNLIAYYTAASKDAKHYTEAQRVEFQSQAVDARIALKNLKPQVQGATAQQIFAEAANQERLYGSNIASRGGVLSGQDARGLLGASILGLGSGMDIAARSAAQQRSAHLSELQRQTELARESRDLLRAIAGKGGKPSTGQIENARRVAGIIGG